MQPQMRRLHVEQPVSTHGLQVVLLKCDQIGVEVPHIKSWPHLTVVRHRKQFNVNIERCEIASALQSHRLLVHGAGSVAVCEQEYSFGVVLLFNLFEFLLADPECFEEWRPVQV